MNGTQRGVNYEHHLFVEEDGKPLHGKGNLLALNGQLYCHATISKEN